MGQWISVRLSHGRLQVPLERQTSNSTRYGRTGNATHRIQTSIVITQSTKSSVTCALVKSRDMSQDCTVTQQPTKPLNYIQYTILLYHALLAEQEQGACVKTLSQKLCKTEQRWTEHKITNQSKPKKWEIRRIWVKWAHWMGKSNNSQKRERRNRTGERSNEMNQTNLLVNQ